MAYYYDPEDYKTAQDQNSVPASRPGSVISGGQSAQGGPSTTAAGTATANNAKTNPGNFVGISQYLDANKPQAQNLANQVGSVITNSANAANTELNNKYNDTENQIKSNTVNYDQGSIDQLNKDASKADVGKIQSMQNATYGGPTSLGSIDSLAAAKQNAANANSEAGREQLVSGLYQNQPLKKGALTFDNLLLQANPDAQNTLVNAQKTANIPGIEQNIANQNAQIQSDAQKAQQTTAQTAANTNTAVGAAQKAFEDSLNQRVKQQQDAATANAKSTLDRLTSAANPVASAQDLGLLGINQNQYNQLYEGIKERYLDPTTIGATIKDPASQINAANVASADDYARYNVLRKLAGQGSLLGDDASQAATFNPNLINYSFVAPIKPTIDLSGNVGTDKPVVTITGNTGDNGTNPNLGGPVLPAGAKPLRTDLQPSDTGNVVGGATGINTNVQPVNTYVPPSFVPAGNVVLPTTNQLRTDLIAQNQAQTAPSLASKTRNFGKLTSHSFY